MSWWGKGGGNDELKERKKERKIERKIDSKKER